MPPRRQKKASKSTPTKPKAKRQKLNWTYLSRCRKWYLNQDAQLVFEFRQDSGGKKQRDIVGEVYDMKYAKHRKMPKSVDPNQTQVPSVVTVDVQFEKFQRQVYVLKMEDVNYDKDAVHPALAKFKGKGKSSRGEAAAGMNCYTAFLLSVLSPAKVHLSIWIMSMKLTSCVVKKIRANEGAD